MNFTQLKTNIQNFIEDDSTELDTSIPEIIKQAESMIFAKDCLILFCYRQTNTGNFSIGTATINVANARNGQASANNNIIK